MNAESVFCLALGSVWTVDWSLIDVGRSSYLIWWRHLSVLWAVQSLGRRAYALRSGVESPALANANPASWTSGRPASLGQPRESRSSACGSQPLSSPSSAL